MKIALILVLGVITGLVSGAGYVWLQQQELPQETLHVVADCAAELKPCLASTTAGQGIFFSFSPQPIPVMEPLQIKVAIDGINAVEAVKVVVEGANMFMGYQYADLVAQDLEWQGSLILPLCTIQVMDWKAQVDVYTANRRYRATFPFKTLSSDQARPIESWLLN